MHYKDIFSHIVDCFYLQIHGLEGEALRKRGVTTIDIGNDRVDNKVCFWNVRMT